MTGKVFNETMCDDQNCVALTVCVDEKVHVRVFHHLGEDGQPRGYTRYSVEEKCDGSCKRVEVLPKEIESLVDRFLHAGLRGYGAIDNGKWVPPLPDR